LWFAILLAGCGSDPTSGSDTAGSVDSRSDGGLLDAAPDLEPDAGSDAGAPDAGSDAGPCTPVPFAPTGKPAGWKHATTPLLVVSQGPANHRGRDAVVAAGQAAVLIGKFAYGPFDKDLKNEDVEVYMQLAPPCGAWKLLGTHETSEDGEHGTTYGITDDGGRVFHPLPASQVPPPGRYPVRMLVRGDHSQAALTLFVLQPGAGAVVFDIDGTLTADDFQLVAQLFNELLQGSYVPKVRPGGVDVVKAWAARGYLPVYLTGRPNQLRQISQSWLVQQGFSPGAVQLTDETSQSMPGDATAQYKTDFLQKLSGSAKAALYAAYGNAESDIQAYENAQIPKSRTFIIGSNAGKQGTVGLKDYTSHLATAQAMPAATVPAPPDTFGW
jgi:hypothetical protein